jgi:hypothetical protein
MSGSQRPARTQAPARAQWYMAEVMDHNHGQAQNAEHAQHMPAAPRKWEPMREIDPRKMHSGQETYEVTQFPKSEKPTPEERRRAEELIEKSRASAMRHGWFEYDNAEKDGFNLLPADNIHYVNRAFALDDVQLDPDRPEFLLFLDTPAGKRLAAFMFLARGPEDHGTQVGGPLTLWHYHAWADPVCLLERRVVIGFSDTRGLCANGVPVMRSPEMMHVWLIKNPGGPFATGMSITEDMRKELAR